MPPITVIDEDFATLYYHPDEKIVHHIFHKPVGGPAFRQFMYTGIDLLKQHSATKWLSDDRLNGALSPEDTQWALTDWVDAAVAGGWKYWALVVPTDLYGRMNMKEFIDSFYNRDVRIMVFTDPEEGMNWLKKR